MPVGFPTGGPLLARGPQAASVKPITCGLSLSQPDWNVPPAECLALRLSLHSLRALSLPEPVAYALRLWRSAVRGIHLARKTHFGLARMSVVICTFFLVRSGFSGKDKQLIMNEHGGEGVVPGRYRGEAIRIHDGPTPEQMAYEEERVEADALAGRICAAAADAARCQFVLVELLGEFDALGGLRHWTGFKSLAHWLSWSCSMTPGVAREHVRVARALRRMPTIANLFREGRLSYSKVRQVTRVVDVVDEARLAGLAVTATAAQLAKMMSGFRSADGMQRVRGRYDKSINSELAFSLRIDPALMTSF